MTARLLAGLCTAALITAACQTIPAASVPALLIQGDTQSAASLIAALEKEMGRSPLNLGPSDPTRSPTISVLPIPPGPLEDRSPALPTTFRLELTGAACALVRETPPRTIPLPATKCRPA